MFINVLVSRAHTLVQNHGYACGLTTLDVNKLYTPLGDIH